MRRRRRKLYLAFPSWLRRKMTYKRNHALHAYEDRVLVALITERQHTDYVLRHPKQAAIEWSWREPGRWDRQYLVMAFKRLSRESKTLRTMAEIQSVRKQAAA